MVKLKRMKKEDYISDTQPPETALFYYGMKKEANLNEYHFYYTVYNKDRSIKSILDSQDEPDKVFKSTSRHALESDMQNSNFITDKDFGVINKYRDKDTRVFIGFVLEPDYSSDKQSWDYGSVFLDINNNIIIKWRH
jgi:hypothetical protein